jgi:Ca2+-binding RTX toxin-like protein
VAISGSDAIFDREGLGESVFVNDIDILIATNFNDTIATNIGRIMGLDGSDKLTGGTSAQTIDGGAGDDVVEGGGGADTLRGGAGNDTLSYAGSSVGVNVMLGTTTGSGGDAQGDRISGFENLIGSGKNDNLRGDGGPNIIDGGGGNDIIRGGGGNDTIDGQAGEDLLFGGGGNDVFRFTELGEDIGNEVFDYTPGKDMFDLAAYSATIPDFATLAGFMSESSGDVTIGFVHLGQQHEIVILNTTIAILTANSADFILA